MGRTALLDRCPANGHGLQLLVLKPYLFEAQALQMRCYLPAEISAGFGFLKLGTLRLFRNDDASPRLPTSPSRHWAEGQLYPKAARRLETRAIVSATFFSQYRSSLRVVRASGLWLSSVMFLSRMWVGYLCSHQIRCLVTMLDVNLPTGIGHKADFPNAKWSIVPPPLRRGRKPVVPLPRTIGSAGHRSYLSPVAYQRITGATSLLPGATA